jgi:hypothetical protein
MDGKPDLATSNTGSNNVSILIGNGNGTFIAAVPYAVGSQPYTVAVGDFNMDGKPDLATSNTGGTNVSILIGNGDGTFIAAVPYAAGSSPISIAVCDFNWDGKSDLAVCGFSTSDVSILIGNGLGAFAAGGGYSVGSNPISVAVGDFNRDGKPDLAVANSHLFSSNVSILLNTPVAVAPTVTNVNPNSGNQGQTLASVILTGTNFSGASIVSFGTGITTNSFNVDNSAQITANISIAPGATPGTRDVSVTTLAGTGTKTASFTVSASQPVVTIVKPNTGNQGQTENVTLTGNYFTNTTSVSFGAGITTNNFNVDNVTQIMANITIAAGATPGTRNVSVTTAATGILTNGFTVLQPTQTVPTATGTGNATFATSAGSISNLTPTASTACGTKPGFSFSHGFFSYNITSITVGSTVTITITLPSAMPAGTQYWKCINGQWVDVTSLLGDNDGDNILTLTIKDGGLGDADGQANGMISDPGGPAFVVQVPSPVQPPKKIFEPSEAPTITNPANIITKNTWVQPQQVVVNQPVTIFANMSNSGDLQGSYIATLKINDQIEAARTGSVPGNAAVPIQFTVTKSQPGNYTVDINGRQAYFTVVGDEVAATLDAPAAAIAVAPATNSSTTDNTAKNVTYIVFGIMVFLAILLAIMVLQKRRSSYY